MKRLLIAAALLIMGIGAASAQQKGDKYFGGMAGLAIQAGDGVGAALAIQPEFGGFVADNWRLGISVGYTLNGLHMFTAALISHIMPAFAMVCTTLLVSRLASL